jgi:hypothetical protein
MATTDPHAWFYDLPKAKSIGPRLPGETQRSYEACADVGDDSDSYREFRVWLGSVDRTVMRLCGLSYFDLPDMDAWSAWDDGATPGSFAREALAQSGFGEA